MDDAGTGKLRQRDAFTAAHWNGRVRVIVHPPAQAIADVSQRARVLFGRAIGDPVWALLVGAPDGAVVEVLPSPAQDYQHGVQLRVDHPWFNGTAIRYLFADADGDVAMVNDWLHVRDEAPPGIGTRLLAHQAATAESLGVLYLAAEAAGSPGSTVNGYYTWARLGFDGLIPEQVRAQLPSEWRARRARC